MAKQLLEDEQKLLAEKAANDAKKLADEAAAATDGESASKAKLEEVDLEPLSLKVNFLFIKFVSRRQKVL